jgi:glycosyltransferase involved in cell wall biosynthesis
VVSEEDRQRFVRKRIAASKIDVLPNGVDPQEMHPDPAAGEAVRREIGISTETKMLLFFGQLQYAPNRDALHALRTEVLPRLDSCGLRYEAIVAGKGDLPDLKRRLAHPRLRFVGAVSDIASYISAADAVLAPIESGGGTRLKILESVACGTPVVSTSIGAEGIARQPCGELLRIADGWDAFAGAVASVGVKPGNVPAPFLDMYSWSNIVGRVDWQSIAHAR